MFFSFFLNSLFLFIYSLVEILRDKDDDDDEDVLINVNIADNELAKDRADLSKKKTPGYRAYDEDESADQFGMVCIQNLFIYTNISYYFRLVQSK